MKSLAIILAAVLLTGCGATSKKVVMLDPIKPRMPADVRQKCDPVPNAPPRGSSMGDLYTWSDSMVDLYADCALRDRAKLRWVESQGM
ncbi:hypothetical protein [Tardiphaga sp. 862_B3_N1_1]|uniref:hypothetical protein n=1 Tax=Tardiphaga sp. 862_B3_N1_1 TaxID=3240763 RepID=UPI003F8AFD21